MGKLTFQMSLLWRGGGEYTGCFRENLTQFGRTFLRLKFIRITKSTYIRSRTFTEILAREVLKNDSCYTFIDY